jgi:hypothetical protein
MRTRHTKEFEMMHGSRIDVAFILSTSQQQQQQQQQQQHPHTTPHNDTFYSKADY